MNARTNDQQLMSMTGFASTQGSFEFWGWSADIRSVNGRSLDLRLRVPDIDGLEPEMRKRLQARLGRGNVTVNLRLQREEGAVEAALNPDALSRMLSLLKEIETSAEEKGLALAGMTAADIAGMRGVIEISDRSAESSNTALKAALLESFDTCLDDFTEDRAREGAALKAILSDQLDRVAALTRAAAQAVGPREDAQRTAMSRAIQRLLETTEVPDTARLSQELAMIAVKTDVTEELDRLGAHIDAGMSLLATQGPVGRKLDFLMQEFNREANTLCSKAQSSALTAIGLDLKTVIDQMREQVQNIE